MFILLVITVDLYMQNQDYPYISQKPLSLITVQTHLELCAYFTVVQMESLKRKMRTRLTTSAKLPR